MVVNLAVFEWSNFHMFNLNLTKCHEPLNFMYLTLNKISGDKLSQ